MKLLNAEIRPGFVTRVEDNIGTIKAMVVGLFDEEDPDLVPPIAPFGTFSKGCFSAPEVGDPIWVLYFKDNPQFLRYIRQCNINSELGHILNQNPTNCEVLMRRDKGLDHAQLYFNDEEGWVMQENGSFIKIDQNGSITLTNGDKYRTIEINDDNISLGSPGASAEPAVLGDKLTDLLTDMCQLLNMVSQAAKANPYTTSISTVIEQQLPNIKDKITTITSINVTLD